MSPFIDNGKPIQIMELKDHQFILKDKELIEILNHEDVRNRNIVVVSIAGAFRKGKSFLLGFCLRYLYAQVNIVLHCIVCIIITFITLLV